MYTIFCLPTFRVKGGDKWFYNDNITTLLEHQWSWSFLNIKFFQCFTKLLEVADSFDYISCCNKNNCLFWAQYWQMFRARNTRNTPSYDKKGASYLGSRIARRHFLCLTVLVPRVFSKFGSARLQDRKTGARCARQERGPWERGWKRCLAQNTTVAIARRTRIMYQVSRHIASEITFNWQVTNFFLDVLLKGYKNSLF